ncbi:MAG: aspartate aminotransferase family protein [Leptospiraceae bacterium]|nr:aspartate aminotransferase family protein [Leptospiraceae bacterium]
MIGISNTIFAVSGGEAIDLAIKMARGYTKKQKVISLLGGYHGHTGLALAAGDQKYKKPFAIQLPDFHQIPFGSWDAMEASLSQDTAALILETCPATLGMPIFPNEVMLRLRKQCTKNNVAMILDEIQTGLGRTGKTWAFQHYDILPDIVVAGKGLSGGIYPIAAVCFSKKYEKLFQKDPFIHISTFGGAELGCFAALKTLELISEPAFLENVTTQAQYFSEQFNTLIRENEEIVEFRQLGLFMAVVFQDSATCLTFIKTLMANGVYAVYANNDKRVMQFLPPLIITGKEAEEVMSIIKTTLTDLKKFKNRLLKKVISTFVIKE